MDKDVIRRRIQFFGRVQHVGFRYRARNAADYVGATGWVRNEYDGSVTMEIQGSREDIDSAILMIEQGRYVKIENMITEELPIVPDERGIRTR